jgi:hypothetical protein
VDQQGIDGLADAVRSYRNSMPDAEEQLLAVLRKYEQPLLEWGEGSFENLDDMRRFFTEGDSWLFKAFRKDYYGILFEYYREMHSRLSQTAFYRRHVDKCEFEYLRTEYMDNRVKETDLRRFETFEGEVKGYFGSLFEKTLLKFSVWRTFYEDYVKLID